jgi:hypothetical protein
MDAKTTSSWYRRPGVFVASAAIATGVSIAVLGPSDRDPAKIDAATPHPTFSMRYILVTADPWAPDPAPPPAAAPPAPVAPPVYDPPATREYVPAYDPPATREYVPPPPPPPPPQVTLRFDDPITSAFVSMANVPDGSPVGCRLTMIPLAGIAASVAYRVPDNEFTLVGSQEARLPAGRSLGPATGSTWRNTVTCDNGTSTSLDVVY